MSAPGGPQIGSGTFIWCMAASNADHSDGARWREARAHKPEPVAQVIAEPAVPPAAPRTRRGKARDGSTTMVAQVPALAVAEALREITSIPAVTLHHGAACVWAARAIACYRVCLGKADLQEGLSYLYLGEHYREAALAHARLGEAWQPMLEDVDALMAPDRAAASAAMQSRSLPPAATP